MSAWKEWQLAMADDTVTDEELEEYERAWLYDCRRDYEIDKALELEQWTGEEF